jgi:hypothetical protein
MRLSRNDITSLSWELGRGSLVTTQPKHWRPKWLALAVGYPHSHSLDHVGVRLAALGGRAES